MKKDYDFSKAERGRFYRKGARLRLPIYLDAKLQNHVEHLAHRTGREIGAVVNHIVEKEMRLIDELDWQPNKRLQPSAPDPILKRRG